MYRCRSIAIQERLYYDNYPNVMQNMICIVVIVCLRLLFPEGLPDNMSYSVNIESGRITNLCCFVHLQCVCYNGFEDITWGKLTSTGSVNDGWCVQSTAFIWVVWLWTAHEN